MLLQKHRLQEISFRKAITKDYKNIYILYGGYISRNDLYENENVQSITIEQQ